MFIANLDAVAVNATGVEVTPGGAAAFIEDATEYPISKKEINSARNSSLRP